MNLLFTTTRDTQYLESTDFDEIWCADANNDFDNDHCDED